VSEVPEGDNTLRFAVQVIGNQTGKDTEWGSRAFEIWHENPGSDPHWAVREAAKELVAQRREKQLYEALSRGQIADLLHERYAVEVGPEHPFKYNELCPDAPVPRMYINIRGGERQPLTPEDLRSIGHHLAYTCFHRVKPFDLVGPLPDAGVPLGEAFADFWPTCPGLLRLKKEVNESGRRIIPATDDPFKPGMRVLLLDDVCATSATKVEGILAFRELGLVVEEGVVLASYRLGGEEEIQSRFGVRLHYSFTVPWLLGYFLAKDWVTFSQEVQAEESLKALGMYMAAHRAA